MVARTTTTTTATVTTGGKVTLPKTIRDALRITKGAQLDFQLGADGAVSMRVLKQSAMEIVGLLKRPGRAAVTLEQMNRALYDSAAERYRRKTAPASGRNPTTQKV